MGVLDDDRAGGESALDAGLQAAFDRRADSARSSVHQVVERLTGSPGIVSLRSPQGSDAPIGASSPELQSRPIGRVSYQLLGEIARGGMGVVVRGHDPDLGRDVALKILHRELSNRPEIVRRFVEEAQIGGQLQHPGIVPVYELGLTADERPYFTMKLVGGRTLAALLAERRDKDEDRRRHLGVFEAVCQTLAYAHSRGVIHRDLKPSNVMVGAFGEVQVVDWGLAKVLAFGGVADERRAQESHANAVGLDTVRRGVRRPGTDSVAGSVMGTPAYMSPEQARGDVQQLDERSDVFGLGAILCEILTGAPPYPRKHELALSHAGRGELGETLGKLDECGADADLVSLCKDCLRPAPADRPRNAQVLAERLHAYLISVEERARRAQIEAARTQVRLEAERKARKLTLALAASLLAGIGGSAWMVHQRDTARRDNEQRVLAALSEAAIAHGQADWPSALSAIERARALTQSDASSAELRARVEREGETIADQARAAERKQALDRDNAALIAELQDIRRPEGDHIYPTGWTQLSQNYRDVFARHGITLDAQDEAEIAAQLGARGIDAALATFLDELAQVHVAAQERDAAERLRHIASRVDLNPTRQRLRAGGHTKATLLALLAEVDVDAQPAPTLHLLASALAALDARPEGVELLRRARRLHPSDFLLAMELARTLLWIEPTQPVEALRHYEAALAIRPDSVEAWHGLGQALEVLGNDAAALEHFRTAAARFPRDGHVHFHLAQALHETGQDVDAIAVYRRSIELEPGYAMAHNNLGNELDRLGQAAEALEEYRRAVELEPQSAMFHSNLGCALSDTGRAEEAIAELKNAIALDPHSIYPIGKLGETYYRLQSFAEADSVLRRAIELDPNVAEFHSDLGAVLLQTGRLEAALVELERAVELAPESQLAVFRLGFALEGLGRIEEAISARRRATELDPQNADRHFELSVSLIMDGRREEGMVELYRTIELDPDYAEAHNNLGQQLAAVGRLEEAIRENRLAVEIDPDDARHHFGLAHALRQSGQVDEAIIEFRRATALEPLNTRYSHELANALQRVARHEEAIAEYRRATELDPRDAHLHFGFSVSLGMIGQGEEAMAELYRAIELEPDFAEAHSNLGVKLAALGRLDEALRENRLAVEIDPDDARHHLGLAYTLQLNGRIDEAIAEYRRALESDHSDHSDHRAHVALSWILATTDREELLDPEQALVHARQAVELAPEDPNDWENLGIALYVAGQYEEALQALEHAIHLGEPEAGARGLFLALCHHRLGDSGEARRWLDGTKPRISELVAAAPELLRFAKEARNILGE